MLTSSIDVIRGDGNRVNRKDGVNEVVCFIDDDDASGNLGVERGPRMLVQKEVVRQSDELQN